MSDAPYVDNLTSVIRERIEEVDRMLFDAGVLVLEAKTNAARAAADRKITDARVKLERLRANLT